MAVLSMLIGFRGDLRLRTKWWHHLAVGLAILSSLLVYLTIAGFVATRPMAWTRENTHSLTLLNHAAGRRTTTTIADLDKLQGVVATSRGDGRLIPLPRHGDETIRCENTPTYKADDKRSIAGVTYRSIPDHPSQSESEARHCLAAPTYASYTADAVAVYSSDGTGRRKQAVKGALAGGGGVVLWLIVYWNLYYRGLIPIYARQREMRRRRRFEQYTVR